MKLPLLFIFLCLFSLPSALAVDTFEFNNESDKSRYKDFVKNMRCPMCQNQNLNGSNSKISIDLRRELHRMISAGQSDDEIVAFMTERYGEFILYKPRLNRDTLLLWGLPIVLALIAMGIIALIIRRARSRQVALSSGEIERAATLLVADSSQNSTPNGASTITNNRPAKGKG